MIDIILGLIIAVLLAAAVIYIIKEKKKGVKCIGCPAAGRCQTGHHRSHQPPSGYCLYDQNIEDQRTATSCCCGMAEQIAEQEDK